MCSLIYILSAHSVFCECLLLVNIWQPILETHLKSEKHDSTAIAVPLKLRFVGVMN